MNVRAKKLLLQLQAVLEQSSFSRNTPETSWNFNVENDRQRFGANLCGGALNRQNIHKRQSKKKNKNWYLGIWIWLIYPSIENLKWFVLSVVFRE